MKVLVLLVLVVLSLFLFVGSALAAPHWNVTMIRSSGDTIWVQAEPWFEGSEPCGGAQGNCANSMFLHLGVSPCPLSVTCTGPAYDVWFYDFYGVQMTLGLKAGVNYTFSGDASAYFGQMMWIEPPPAPPECMLMCSEYKNFEPVVFGGPVDTNGLTWGAIKALFR